MTATAMEDLQPRAQAALVNSPFYELRRIAGPERGRTLLISGCVTSFYHKQLAQEVVRSVCSDTEVINTIRVKSEEKAVPQSPLPPT